MSPLKQERSDEHFRGAYLRTYPVQAAEIDGRRRSFRTPGTSGAARCVHLAAFSRRVLIYGLGSGRKVTASGKGTSVPAEVAGKRKKNNRREKGGWLVVLAVAGEVGRVEHGEDMVERIRVVGG